MPKNYENNFGKFFNLPNPGLRSYFDIVRVGQPEEYRTTFAKGSSVQEVLKDWESTLNSLSDKWPTLVDFENDLRAKVGPMSIMKPLEQRLEDIDHYYDDILLPSQPISDRAINAVLHEFAQVRGLRPRGQERTIVLMKKSTNSGSPYFTKRKNVISKTYVTETFGLDGRVNKGKHPTVGMWLNLTPNGRNANQYKLMNIDSDFNQHSVFYQAAAVLGWRGQEGGPKEDDVKQRVVWMFPFSVNINELQVYQPLIESCQMFNLVPAWVSMESVDKEITQLFDTKGADDLVVCTDFSKFDQHFNQDMQDAAKAILTGILDSTFQSQRWLNYVFPIKYWIPLAYDYDKIRFGKHGMGSGSGGTNADETLTHRALQHEAALAKSSKLNPHSQCNGDDGVLSYPGITVDDVVRSYTAHGQEMNESKQYASKQDCIYLRRWHHKDYRQDGICVGVYSTYRALGRLMEQERFYDPEVWNREMVALRQLSIIENVKYHPLKEQFVDFCMKRDKYRLGLDIPGFLDNIDRISRKATDLMPDFLGYTKSMMPDARGLSTWWVVEYLKSKR